MARTKQTARRSLSPRSRKAAEERFKKELEAELKASEERFKKALARRDKLRETLMDKGIIETVEIIIHACGHDGSADKFLLCESVQALVLAALRNPNLNLEKVTVGDGADVTACTVFELNREWGIEDLGQLTVSEGDAEEDRIQRIDMNIQIVRNDCAVLKRCLKAIDAIDAADTSTSLSAAIALAEDAKWLHDQVAAAKKKLAPMKIDDAVRVAVAGMKAAIADSTELGLGEPELQDAARRLEAMKLAVDFPAEWDLPLTAGTAPMSGIWVVKYKFGCYGVDSDGCAERRLEGDTEHAYFFQEADALEFCKELDHLRVQILKTENFEEHERRLQGAVPWDFHNPCYGLDIHRPRPLAVHTPGETGTRHIVEGIISEADCREICLRALGDDDDETDDDSK